MIAEGCPQDSAREGEERFLVGLGNPGSRYEQTRHNAGYRVVERLWRAHAEGPARRGLGVEYRVGRTGSCEVFMARSLSFMNESGAPVSALVRSLGGTSEGMLVIHDDLDLPLGMIRFRRRGSSGGHRGVASLIEAFGSRPSPSA